MSKPTDPPNDLCPEDRDIIDAVVDAGFDLQRLEAMPAERRRRAQAAMTLFELLDDYPVEDADDSLIHATLARIDRAEDDRAARLSFSRAREVAEGGTRRRLRLPDFLSVAAVILIGASVVWPVASYVHDRALDNGCANHMRRLALSFNQYADDYSGLMPTAQAGLFQSWSPSAHNSVNLGPLVRLGYCDVEDLTCPGRASHQGQFGDSYSYQWQLPGHRASWSGGRVMIVLGDRNPLVDAACQHRPMDQMTLSFNHGGRGQYILANDGTYVWLTKPIAGPGDNIWLPAGRSELRAGDAPTDPGDIFLAH